jgi:hypothetical protein
LPEGETRSMRLQKARDSNEIFSNIDKDAKSYILPFGAKFSIKRH